MSRRIHTITYQSNTPGVASIRGDDFTDRIVKLVPADVVAGWLSVTGAIRAAGDRAPSMRVQWIVFAVGLLFAALWTWKKTHVKGDPPPYTQTSVSTLAFAVWAYATGGVLSCWPGALYNPLYAIFILVGFSLLSGLVTKP